MNIPIKIIMVLLLIVLSPITVFGDTVTRTIDGNNYTRAGNLSENITVVLTGAGSNFTMWGCVETLPLNTTIEVITSNASVINKGNGIFSFVSIDGNILRYKITANETAPVGMFNVLGEFTTGLSNGSILGTQINIMPKVITREDALAAVSEYFTGDGSMTKENVLSIVRAYLGL